MRDLASDGNIKNEGGCEVLGIGQQQTAGRLPVLSTRSFPIQICARAATPESKWTKGQEERKKINKEDGKKFLFSRL